MQPQDREKLPFEVSQPEAAGVPSSSILRFLQALDAQHYRLHAFLLMRRGKLVFSGAAAPYTLFTPHRVYSAGKSILALSACRAMQDGRMKPTDSIADYFRDILAGDTRFDEMTVDDLLTMRSGQTEDPFLALFENLDADLLRLFFQAPPVEAPGTTFRYNNTIPSILTAAVERAVKEPFERYQQRHFTEPMQAPIFAMTDSRGEYHPVIMAMSATSLMKYTALFLNKGNWEGKQLLDSEILRECVCEHTRTGLPGNAAGYGWQIWRNAFGGYRLDGGFGQFGIVLPEEDLAAVIMSDMPDSSFALEAFEREIIAKLSASELEADSAGQKQLAQFSQSMSLAPRHGLAVSPRQDGWFERSYQFDDPAMRLSFEAMENTLRLTLQNAQGTQTFDCGLNGSWVGADRHILVTPERTIDNGVYCLDQNACLLTAVWEDENTLLIASKSLAAQGEYLYRFAFSQEGVTLSYPPRPCRGWPSLEHAVQLHGKGANAS